MEHIIYNHYSQFKRGITSKQSIQTNMKNEIPTFDINNTLSQVENQVQPIEEWNSKLSMKGILMSEQEFTSKSDFSSLECKNDIDIFLIIDEKEAQKLLY